jgi:hypothetical protein
MRRHRIRRCNFRITRIRMFYDRAAIVFFEFMQNRPNSCNLLEALDRMSSSAEAPPDPPISPFSIVWSLADPDPKRWN